MERERASLYTVSGEGKAIILIVIKRAKCGKRPIQARRRTMGNNRWELWTLFMDRKNELFYRILEYQR